MVVTRLVCVRPTDPLQTVHERNSNCKPIDDANRLFLVNRGRGHQSIAKSIERCKQNKTMNFAW